MTVALSCTEKDTEPPCASATFFTRYRPRPEPRPSAPAPRSPRAKIVSSRKSVPASWLVTVNEVPNKSSRWTMQNWIGLCGGEYFRALSSTCRGLKVHKRARIRAASFEGTNYSNGLPSDRAHDRKSKRKDAATPIGIREIQKDDLGYRAVNGNQVVFERTIPA